MAELIKIPEFKDKRGSLYVIEKFLPFKVKRIYFIKNPKGKRGEHRHHKSIQALICINGSCNVHVNNGQSIQDFNLNVSNCLILEPKDWHYMNNFSENCILLVLASTFYDVNDYIDEIY